jgi:hypothetical protein
VLFLDRLEPCMAVDEACAPVLIDTSWNVGYFVDIMRRFGLDGSYGLFCNGGSSTIGLSRSQILERVGASAALINLMGFLDDEDVLGAAHKRVFLDLDPGFGQMWQALGLHETFRDHDAYVTIAENIGKPECDIPTCGLTWMSTRPPIVLDEWPCGGWLNGTNSSITTLAMWRGPYGPIEYQGTRYGLRAHEFRKFMALPGLTGRRFKVALDIDPADGKDTELLKTNGWALVDPRDAAADPWQYRQFIQRSTAEVMIAKGMYVQTRGGWFSDRSICYLASGKPVLAQDTGLEHLYPTGEGLITFSTVEEAAAGVEEIWRDGPRHVRAARALAEEYFDSDKVLTRLVEKLGV